MPAAAVHRLHTTATAQERERILAEARAGIADWHQQQRRDASSSVREEKPASEPDHLADALARPLEDGLTRYQREAAEREAAEQAAKGRREREQQREQRRQATEGWEAWIGSEIERRVGELGQRDNTLALLKVFDEHNQLFERVAERLTELRSENAGLKFELAKVRGEHAAAFEKVTARLAELERAGSQTAAATRKVADRITEALMVVGRLEAQVFAHLGLAFHIGVALSNISSKV